MKLKVCLYLDWVWNCDKLLMDLLLKVIKLYIGEVRPGIKLYEMVW